MEAREKRQGGVSAIRGEESVANSTTPCKRTTINDFTIMKALSQGAFGRVYLARKNATGDLFALKVRARIRYCARASTQLCFNSCSKAITDGAFYLVTSEYISIRYFGHAHCSAAVCACHQDNVYELYVYGKYD